MKGGGSNGDMFVSRSCHGRVGPLQNVQHTETLVSARIRTGAQTPPDVHVKGQGGLQTLYQREEPHPPGLPLATHVNPSKVNDEIPLEAEVEAVVRRLRPHRAGSHTRLRAEHFNQW